MTAKPRHKLNSCGSVKLRSEIAGGTQFYDEVLDALLDRALHSPPIGTSQDDIEKTLRDILDGAEPLLANGHEPPPPAGPGDYGQIQIAQVAPAVQLPPLFPLTIGEWVA